MTGEEINYIGITLANMIANDLSIDDIAILSEFFCVLGDGLGVIAATRTKDNN